MERPIDKLKTVAKDYMKCRIDKPAFVLEIQRYMREEDQYALADLARKIAGPKVEV